MSLQKVFLQRRQRSAEPNARFSLAKKPCLLIKLGCALTMFAMHVNPLKALREEVLGGELPAKRIDIMKERATFKI